MDKPISLSIKDYLIRRIVADTAISEKTVSAIIDHQFNSMVEATKSGDSVEIAGFGRFYFYRKKALKREIKYVSQIKMYEGYLEDDALTERRRKNIELRLIVMHRLLDSLRNRLYGLGTDL